MKIQAKLKMLMMMKWYKWKWISEIMNQIVYFRKNVGYKR